MFISKNRFDYLITEIDRQASLLRQEISFMDGKFSRAEKDIRASIDGHENTRSVIEIGIFQRMAAIEQSVKGMQVLFNKLADTNKRIDLIINHLGLYEHKVNPRTELRSKGGPEPAEDE